MHLPSTRFSVSRVIKIALCLLPSTVAHETAIPPYLSWAHKHANLLCLFFLSSYGDVYPRILSARHRLLITIIICSIICSLCTSCDNVAPNALNIDSNRAHLPDYSLLSRLGLSCDQHCSVVDVPCFVPLATDYRSPVPSILSFLPVNTVRLDDWMIGRAALVALLTDLG